MLGRIVMLFVLMLPLVVEADDRSFDVHTSEEHQHIYQITEELNLLLNLVSRTEAQAPSDSRLRINYRELYGDLYDIRQALLGYLLQPVRMVNHIPKKQSTFSQTD